MKKIAHRCNFGKVSGLDAENGGLWRDKMQVVQLLQMIFDWD